MLTSRQHNILISISLLILLLAAAVRACAADAASAQPAKTVVEQSAGEKKALEVGKADKGGDDFLGSWDTEEKQAEEKDPPVYVTALGFIFRFVLVLGLAYGTILALKRFGGARSVLGGANRKHIKVLENSPIGANRSLHVVEVGSRKFLVASTPSSVNLISELQDADLPEVQEPEPANAGFKEQLHTFLGNKNDSTNAAKSVGSMLRDSSVFISEKVLDISRLRRKFRDA